MKEAKRVAKNTGILYAQMGITVSMSLYTTRLVLAALGAEDFGIFNVVGGAIVMLTFLNTAMAAASQRFMSFAQGEGNFKKQKNIFNISLVLHFLIAIIVIILLEIVGYFLFNGILKIAPERLDVAKLIYQFLIISTFFTIISVPYDAIINAHENMLFVAILRIGETILKLAIALFITYTIFDRLYVYGLLMASLSIVLMVVRQIYCHRKYEEVDINLKKYFNKPLFKEMTGFAGWSFLGSSSSILTNYGQGIVINMFFGTAVNAAQGVSAQVSGQLSTFARTMLKALNPLIAKSEGAGDRILMLKASFIGSKLSFFLLTIFYVPVILEMPYIFGFWLKEVPEYAIIFCQLVLIRNLIEQLYITLISSIAAVGNIRKFQTYTAIINFLPLIAAYILFTLGYPPYALYFVFIIYSLSNGLITLFFAKKECGLSIKEYFKDVILKCILSFLIVLLLTAIPNHFMPEGFLRLITVLAVSTIFFFIVVGLIGLTNYEKNMAKTILNNVYSKYKTKL
ncbi:MATE family efflux transporter [Algibacter sp. L4_22]|uniref:MATE family efflux transporter n=1 Tax=Algibacter sp. L4_22 TaxID=2942477 RepID=UPI00201B7B5F|nr:MATE family efflux transporter [Algibacter sp. L4_22]MCL5129856.1 MATE family efflux transporter [Algibacter sp. L4_22]